MIQNALKEAFKVIAFEKHITPDAFQVLLEKELEKEDTVNMLPKIKMDYQSKKDSLNKEPYSLLSGSVSIFELSKRINIRFSTLLTGAKFE